jgi:hypothetical protein
MPYRDQLTVESWVREFTEQHPGVATEISVLDKDYTAAPDSGLVIVSLRTASTVTYIHVAMVDDTAKWIVTFEARNESFDLDAEGVARLADDLSTLGLLCTFLQDKTDAALRQAAVPEAL